MKILLKRTYNNDKYCIGHLYVDGKFVCDTIEDTDRGLDQKMSLAEIKKRKIKSRTAIPTGTYKVTLKVVSPKYSKKNFFKNFCGGKMPRIVNVIGYDGILMHTGNTAEDSDGCVIVGENKVKGKVINSTENFVRLYNIMLGADKKNEEIWITIERTYKI